MQSLLAKLDYVESGVIHNLDEGDPEIVYFKRFAETALAQKSKHDVVTFEAKPAQTKKLKPKQQ